jgi:hypothetical protein
LPLRDFVDPNSAKEIGKLLSVEAIATGTITDLGATIKINARLIATDTGSIFSTASVEITKDETIRRLMGTLQDLGRDNVKYHVGGSYLIGLTSQDNYMPLGVRFFYHFDHYTIGAFLGRTIDYGYEFVENDKFDVSLLFHGMTFGEISCDYLLSNKKPISTFVGFAITYSNPIRSEYSRQIQPPYDSIYRDRKIAKIGVHPQIGLYLQRNFPISARIAGGYAIFAAEKEGMNHSAITFEGALLLSF